MARVLGGMESKDATSYHRARDSLVNLYKEDSFGREPGTLLLNPDPGFVFAAT